MAGGIDTGGARGMRPGAARAPAPWASGLPRRLPSRRGRESLHRVLVTRGRDHIRKAALLPIAIVGIACGGGQDRASATSDSSAADPAGHEGTEPAEQPGADAERVYLELDIHDLVDVREPGDEQTRVELVATDVAGDSERRGLGVFAGRCTEADVGGVESGLPSPAILGADCPGRRQAGRVRIVREDDEVVALRAWVELDEAGEATEIPDYDELARIEVGADADVLTRSPPSQ